MDRLENQLIKYINRHYKPGRVDRASQRKNVNPKIWGAAGWKFIEKIVDGYPVQASARDRMHMLEFLTSLGHVLPCSKCRTNHITFSSKHPPSKYVQGRTQVRKWVRMYKNTQK